MKKLLLFFSLLLMIISLAGCGSAKPEDTVEKYFTAAQKLDFETMASTIVPTNEKDVQEAKDLMNEELKDEYTKYFVDYLKKNADKISYSINGSEVNGDKAVVTANCKYIDGGPLLKATVGELFSKMIGKAFTGVEPTEEETSQMFLSIMQEQSKNFGETYVEKAIKINCVQRDGTWYIENLSDDIQDVVMSGFISAGKEISNSFSGSSKGPNDVLFEISNYVTGDLWNDGFCEISHYLEDGRGATGQEIDIDFTKSQLEKAMTKKAGYDEYIAGLNDDYKDIKDVWSKLSSQIDSIYQEVKSGAKSLNTDLFTQYNSAFSDLVYGLD